MLSGFTGFIWVVLNVLFDIIENVHRQVNRGICMIHKFQPALLNSVSRTIFKSFVRPHLDRSDVINDQAYKE